MSTNQIGIVDDHNLFREGIKSLLEKMDNCSLVLEAINGTDLLKHLQTTKSNVLTDTQRWKEENI
jgi:DNA-binding NarL/FixJ family response regulator